MLREIRRQDEKASDYVQQRVNCKANEDIVRKRMKQELVIITTVKRKH
jgi:hypothetical protein